MNLFTYLRLTFFWGLILLLSFSCTEDNVTIYPSAQSITTIEEIVHSGSLLISFEKLADQYCFYFESDTLFVPQERIRQIELYKDSWKASITYQDNHTQVIGLIGDTIIINDGAVKLNPTGYAPLSAQVQFSTPVSGRVRITIKGKDGPTSDVSHFFMEEGYNHQLMIHGLYPNYANRVHVTFTDKNGRERVATNLSIQTPSLSTTIMPVVTVTKANVSEMEPGFTLVSYPGESRVDPARPFIMDPQGEIRWLLDFKNHPILGNLTYGVGIERLTNGNLYFGDNKTHAIYEVDMMGNILNQWNLEPLGYNFHHNVQEMPSGNFLITVSKADSKHELGNYVINDFVVEINRETGGVVTEWDLKESLNQWREVMLKKPLAQQTASINWLHANAVIPCENEDAIIVSARLQGLIKLTRTNKVQWILAPHNDWGTNGRGEDLSNWLLHPVDGLGTEIITESVLNGKEAHPDFEWWWGGHAPCFMPNGNLLAFDNGFKRHYSDEASYSRAVEYHINESSRQLSQVWQYGKERGLETYASAVSDVDYLPDTGHVLFCPGIRTPNSDGSGGKIIEVDYNTNEVVFEAEITSSNGFSFHRAERMFIYPSK